MNKSELDRLGERLRSGVTAVDLTLLDTYRRGFRDAYDTVLGRVRSETGLELSGRTVHWSALAVHDLRGPNAGVGVSVNASTSFTLLRGAAQAR